MSRILFIRVSAATFDEKDVPRAWPMTFALVWPDPMLEGIGSPARLARKLIADPKRGVLELVQAFVEHVRFAEMPDARRKALQSHADKLEALRLGLDEALGDRDVPRAHALTNAIEEALDDAEKAVRESA